MLHIVNGDHFGNKLKQLHLPGDVLVWREALNEGPLSFTFTDDATRRLRAEYFDRCHGVASADFLLNSLEQETQLAAFHKFDDVVLWFEHDLFDQMMMIFLLQWFARQDLGTTKLHLLCIGEFPKIEHFTGLGQLTTEQIKTLVGKWTLVTHEQFMYSLKVWKAYSSSDPLEVEAMINGEGHRDFPFLTDALLCHADKFPSAENGLNAVQRCTLEQLTKGKRGLIALFQTVGQQLIRYGISDTQFWNELDRMRQCSSPLIWIEGPPELPKHHSLGQGGFSGWAAHITDFGRSVLSGKNDHVEHNGVDCWLGGLHLRGKHQIWRWDERKRHFRLK